MTVNIKHDLDEVKHALRYAAPKNIRRAKRDGINRAAAKTRTDRGGRGAVQQLQEEIQPRRGARSAIGRRIELQRARGDGSAYVHFLSAGIGIEQTGKATTRKVYGKRGYRVSLSGAQKLEKAFKFPNAPSLLFVRSQGRLKRVYSYTVHQEAQHIDLYDELTQRAPEIAVAEFIRRVRVLEERRLR